MHQKILSFHTSLPPCLFLLTPACKLIKNGLKPMFKNQFYQYYLPKQTILARSRVMRSRLQKKQGIVWPGTSFSLWAVSLHIYLICVTHTDTQAHSWQSLDPAEAAPECTKKPRKLLVGWADCPAAWKHWQFDTLNSGTETAAENYSTGLMFILSSSG